jgi:AcrR family transcriptional regulator
MTGPDSIPNGVPSDPAPDPAPAPDPDPAPDPAPAGERPLRAHALRNRENLLATARAAFATADESVSLESIARTAGVGIGTLYRHFPTREVLVEAVYAAELEALASSAPALLEQFAPELAMRAWIEGYAQFAATKRGMIDTLRAGWAAGRITTPATRERLTGAIALILEAGARAGTLRSDVVPDDVITLLLGVFMSTATGSAPEQAGRLLDLIVDALRPKG